MKYSEVQKSLGTERPVFEFLITLSLLLLTAVMAFASYAHIVLAGTSWPFMLFVYPLLGIVPILLRFRSMSNRAARMQRTFEACVGIPSSDFHWDTVLEAVSPIVQRTVMDPVTGMAVYVCSVECGVYVYGSAGYPAKPRKYLVAFAFDDVCQEDEFAQRFVLGATCKVEEDGPIMVPHPVRKAEVQHV